MNPRNLDVNQIIEVRKQRLWAVLVKDFHRLQPLSRAFVGGHQERAMLPKGGRCSCLVPTLSRFPRKHCLNTAVTLQYFSFYMLAISGILAELESTMKNLESICRDCWTALSGYVRTLNDTMAVLSYRVFLTSQFT